jgi:hypothetical protein
MTVVFRPNPSGDAADGYGWIESLFNDCELVLVEGNSATTQTKLEVWREAIGTEPMAIQDFGIAAVISDDAPVVRQPVWGRNNISTLADRILNLARD